MAKLPDDPWAQLEALAGGFDLVLAREVRAHRDRLDGVDTRLKRAEKQIDGIRSAWVFARFQRLEERLGRLEGQPLAGQPRDELDRLIEWMEKVCDEVGSVWRRPVLVDEVRQLIHDGRNLLSVLRARRAEYHDPHDEDIPS